MMIEELEILIDNFPVVFKSLVACTGKKTGTGLDRTDLDWTFGCSCVQFQMERPPVAEPVATGFVKTGQ